ncbi:MAG TPA: hypothetical protein DHW36_08545 [Thalassospira sp.]|nr:hypothetical protein [Thalassospira sp.]
MHGPAKEQLVAKIDGALLQAIEKSTDINQLINLAEHYGKFHWLNTTNRWACPQVERHVFNKVSSQIATNATPSNKSAVTHVLSEGYDVGGHTPLCINLAKEQAQRGENVQLAITRNVTSNVASDIKQSGISTHVCSGSHIEKINRLTNLFLQSKAVVLHIHPDDIVACCAAMFAEQAGIPCLFVNHADIHFSYGPSQCSTVLEISAGSWLSTQAFRHPKSQSFLGIPCADLNVSNEPAENKDAGNYFITVGGAHKYHLDNSTIFVDFVEELCGKLGEKLKIIGVGNATPFSKLSDKAKSNLELLGTQSRDATILQMKHAKAYIDSFPEGGGTSVTNAMLLCLPTFGCKAKGGMFGDDYLSDTPDELIVQIQHLTKDGPDTTKLQERAEFIRQTFSLKACADRLDAAITGAHVPVPFDFQAEEIDLTFYQKQWLSSERLYVPPFIKINAPQQL